MKIWGVVARFNVQNIKFGKQEIVFKASQLPLFNYGPFVDKLLMEYCSESVPEMLAYQAWPDKTWILFKPFSGQQAASIPGIEPIIKIAESFANIQTIIAGVPAAKWENIPHTKICSIPEQLEKIIKEIEDKQWKIWSNNRPEYMDKFRIPDDLCNKLRAQLPKIDKWATELTSMNWPYTIDHVDLHTNNAVICPDGRLLIFDWEEAVISCPFFSIDRLLSDAREIDVESKLVDENHDGKYSKSELCVRNKLMKNLLNPFLLIIFTITLFSGCSASSGSKVTKTPPITNQVAGDLGITSDQAEAGLGAMMMLSRNKLSPDDFAALSRSFPGGGNNLINKATRLGVIPGTLGTTTDLINTLSKLGMSYSTAANFIPAVLRITSGLDGNTYELLSKVF